MMDLPKRALRNELPGLSQRWRKAVVVAHHVADLGPLRRRQHRGRLFDIGRQRFLAQHMFARSSRRLRDFRVRFVRRDNIDDFNQRRFNDLLPIRGRELPSQLRPGRLYRRGIPPTDRVQLDPGIEREKIRGLPPGVRMDPAHEPITHHPDPESFCHVQSWG